MTKKSMKKKEALLQDIKQLCCSQPFAVLATTSKNKPYTNLVAFACSNDLKTIYFPTKKNTQKHQNIMKNNEIALLLDNRQNKPSDFTQAITLTAFGTASETTIEKHDAQQLLLTKHPDLAPFLKNKNCIILKINVDLYQWVDQFDHIKRISMKNNSKP